MTDYQALLPYAETETQRNVIDACIHADTVSGAAKQLGVDQRNVYEALKRVKRRAAAQGYSPEHDMTKPAPNGFAVKGTSTLYDAETGEAKIQWVKTQADQNQRLEMLRDALHASFDEVKPLKAIKAPKRANKDLLSVIPLGDPHVGMYAWAEETGENYDTKIATELHEAAVDRLVNISPDAETGVLLNLGDFFHADNMDARTRRSGNALDVDTRWADVMTIGVELMVRLIRRMLEKHKRVIVKNNIGNHDEHSSVMLAIALNAFFRGNKRVQIDTSPYPFWYHRHGKVLIASTHGDKTKPQQLAQLMASDKPSDWGETAYRYWYIGHVHHQARFEFPGVEVESFRTLAAKDAWHSAEGYRSARDMHCIVHHKDQGDVERHRVAVEQL
jgi:hypothetical protein